MTPSQRLSRSCPRVGSVFDDDHAVHDDVIDSDRVVLWIVLGGVGTHCFRVENNDIGPKTISQNAPVGQAEPLRRERGHLANRLGQF